MARISIKSLFRITPGLREKHDYRRDASYDGRYLKRLPDRTLVRADEYDAQRSAWQVANGEETED